MGEFYNELTGQSLSDLEEIINNLDAQDELPSLQHAAEDLEIKIESHRGDVEMSTNYVTSAYVSFPDVPIPQTLEVEDCGSFKIHSYSVLELLKEYRLVTGAKKIQPYLDKFLQFIKSGLMAENTTQVGKKRIQTPKSLQEW